MLKAVSSRGFSIKNTRASFLFRLKQQNQFLAGVVHNSSLDFVGTVARVAAAMDNCFNKPLRFAHHFALSLSTTLYLISLNITLSHISQQTRQFKYIFCLCLIVGGRTLL